MRSWEELKHWHNPDVVRFYKTLQFLSIDIVLGAVILLHFFSAPFNVNIEWPVYVLLATAVWCIYTLDHLRDAIKAVGSNRERYQFHMRHAQVLRKMIGAVSTLSLICLIYLPSEILNFGIVLSFFCLLYILFQSRLAAIGLKEFYVAGMYALGILLAPMALAGYFNSFLFFILGFMAFLNLMIFSWFEYEQDKEDMFSSIATVLGKTNSRKLIVGLGLAGVAIAIYSLRDFSYHSLYFGIVCSVYLILILNPGWAGKNERYRMLGDGVFILPVLFELL